MCIQNQNQLRGQMDNKVNKFKYLLLGKHSANMCPTLVQFFLQKKIFLLFTYYPVPPTLCPTEGGIFSK